jgi:hypothetical protein
MTIKVSHESPIALLPESTEYNDYQYCLVHLMEEQEEYKEWFLEKFQTKVPYGEILLDNSIFELKEAFNSEKYAVWCERIKPNYYIVPDVLEDSWATMTKMEEWDKQYGNDLPGLKIGAVQGKTWTEIVECYRFMTAYADYIAISFDLSMYQVTGASGKIDINPKLKRQMTGRQHLVKRLIDEGWWDWEKPHHLLGASLAREFKWYVDNNIYNIRSLDTSNPVVAGLLGHTYNGDFGLSIKPSTLLADLINAQPDEDAVERIQYNTSQFKRIIKRKYWE